MHCVNRKQTKNCISRIAQRYWSQTYNYPQVEGGDDEDPRKRRKAYKQTQHFARYKEIVKQAKKDHMDYCKGLIHHTAEMFKELTEEGITGDNWQECTEIDEKTAAALS